jgi:hypothetical protein
VVADTLSTSYDITILEKKRWYEVTKYQLMYTSVRTVTGIEMDDGFI